MERIIKTILLLAGIAVLITGCERLQPPEAPLPLSPDEIMIKEASPVVFFWQTTDEADEYALQVATDEEFENTVYANSSITDTSLVVDAETFEKLTMYYWQVAASNPAGSSEWSKTNRFFYGTQDWLISPADSVIFHTDAPTLVWHSYPEATGYVVRVCRNSFSSLNTAWEDTVSDTTYQLPYEVLMENHPATYHWSVMFLGTSENLFWAPSRCFFSRIMPDLDTTYFPFGLGYEWCCERHDVGWDYQGEEPVEWDTYDTFTVNVVDSFWSGDTLFFQYQGDFRDLETPVKIWQNKIPITVCPWVCYHDTIPIMSKSDTSFDSGGISIAYKGDSLSISAGFEPTEREQVWVSTLRLKCIGVTSQGYSYWCPGAQHSIGERLLYFYNGKDTVYKALGG